MLVLSVKNDEWIFIGRTNGESGTFPVRIVLIESRSGEARLGIVASREEYPVWREKPLARLLGADFVRKTVDGLKRSLGRAQKGTAPPVVAGGVGEAHSLFS